ncbi:hypothetical protein RB653_007771 [Dictyostelium firmibasis]|uniref:TBC domain-containing protein kinase-like protein n=1 Tax=Dictyostelium firmibasis TaxID=79012 RepID=A0AAN7TUZ9_9MYCE
MKSDEGGGSVNNNKFKDNTFRKYGVEVVAYNNNNNNNNCNNVAVNSRGYQFSIHPFSFRNKLTINQSGGGIGSSLSSSNTTPKPQSFYIDDAGIAKQLNQSIFDILSRSRYLSSLSHENLAEFIAAEPSQKHHDQMLIVSEDYKNSLEKQIEIQAKKQSPISSNTIGRYAYQILKALSYLHSQDLTHRSLSLDNIKLDDNNQIKLTNYGLYYLSDHGENVSFPIGNLLYLSPESLLRGTKGSSNTKADVWALGCILLHICLGYCIWQDNNPSIVINRILHLSGYSTTQLFNTTSKSFEECELKRNQNQKGYEEEEEISEEEKKRRIKEIKLNNRENMNNFLNSLKENNNNNNNNIGIGLNGLDKELIEIIEQCLIPNPMDRPDSETLLDHPYFNEYKKMDPYQLQWIIKPFTKSWDLPDSLESLSLKEIESYGIGCENESESDSDIYSGKEIYYIWKLLGGNIEKELVNKGFAKPSPSVHKLPLYVPVKASLTESTSSGLNSPQHQYQHQHQHNQQHPNIIKSKNSTVYNNEFCLIELSIVFSKIKESFKVHGYKVFEEGYESSLGSTKFNNIENNIELQIIIIREFHKLLYQYQYDDPTLSQPKIYRLAKLFVPPILRGDIWSAILGVNEKEAKQLYNSINLDLKGPNDKQFELDIPRCHQYHPLLSSRQGHVQLFKILKAWSLLNIEKGCYWQGLDNVASPFLVHHFFNEPIAFASLKAFVDKYLSILYVPNNHAALSEIMLIYQQLLAYHDPELLNHLIEIQLDPNLYSIPWFITVFAHILPIDKLEILWDSILLCPSSLPNFIAASMIIQFRDSILKMNFEDGITMMSMIPSVDVHKCVRDALTMFNQTPLSTTVTKFVSNTDQELWWMQEVPFEKRKLELFPRIDIHDLINDQQKVIVDIRPPLQFQQIHYPSSINVNPKLSKLQQQMEQYKGQQIVVIAPKDSGVEFTNQLIQWKFPFVSMLNGGMDSLEHGAYSLLITSNKN